MVVRIRMARWGRRNLPYYRIVVADSRSPRDGKFIEKLGMWNPLPFQDEVKELALDSSRVKYWLSVGAQPSDRVAWLLGKAGILPPAPKRDSIKSAVPKFLRTKEKK